MTIEDNTEIGGCRILVVDDNEMNRNLASGILCAAGIRAIEFAADGLEGLEKVETFSPDLIVLDVMMPRMDGHEFLRRLRNDRRHADLPVLVTTALSGANDRTAVFDLGATDYLEKPLNGREMISRVRVHLRNRVMLARLGAYHARLSQDLATLTAMQEALLPSPGLLADLGRLYGVSIAPFFKACDELGGDLWGAWGLDESHLGLFMADFSGHGVTAAVNTFRLHLLMEQTAGRSDPAEFLTVLNAALVRTLPRGQYATMVYGVMDTRNGEVAYASAGAPAAVIGVGGRSAALPAGGLPLGIVENAAYVTCRAEVPPGGYLCVYSDALIESPDGEGAILGEAGVVDLIGRSAGEGAEQSLTRLLDGFMGCRPGPLNDDLTVVWLKRH